MLSSFCLIEFKLCSVWHTKKRYAHNSICHFHVYKGDKWCVACLAQNLIVHYGPFLPYVLSEIFLTLHDDSFHFALPIHTSFGNLDLFQGHSGIKIWNWNRCHFLSVLLWSSSECVDQWLTILVILHIYMTVKKTAAI